jgi:hypothetical protein
MKELMIKFTDEEMRRLREAKKKQKSKNLSWHQFIIYKCCRGISLKRDESKRR